MHYYIKRYLFKYIFIILSLVGLVITAFLDNKIQENIYTDICNFSVRSDDSVINIQWSAAQCNGIDHIELTISGKNGTHETNISPSKTSYSYEAGVHGEWYAITIVSRFTDGSYGEEFTTVVPFLVYDKLPDIPLIIINTSNGLEPPYEEAVKPDESLAGRTIINNESVPAEYMMRQSGCADIASRIKIKVRGNTSSVAGYKQSYKIILNEPMDLLGRGTKYANKNWVLLNSGTNLKTYIGEYVAGLYDVEWSPEMMFVNVILNGDWKGCFLLIESVDRSVARVNVSNTGYIFENNAYWWKPDVLYFQLEHQHVAMRYTFKYPHINNSDDPRFFQLQQYMQEYEDLIFSGNVEYRNYIDEESFAKWILVRDLMGEFDGLGSNMYFYKYDFELDNPTSSKVKMGPLWDFDGSFMVEGEWSNSRLNVGTYFPKLFEQESFNQIYMKLFQSKEETVVPDIETYLRELEYLQGEALNQSWILDCQRWGHEYIPIEEQIKNDVEWLSKRVVWMKNALEDN